MVWVEYLVLAGPGGVSIIVRHTFMVIPMSVNFAPSSPVSSWRFKRVGYIEELRDAVEGAGLTATQLSLEPVAGTLAFSHWNGILFSSGFIEGKFALNGVLSEDLLTIGTGLVLNGRCQHWLRDIEAGTVGIFGPGEDHDAIYTGNTLYIGMSAHPDRLALEAERLGLAIDPVTIQTGLSDRPLLAGSLRYLASQLFCVHRQDQYQLRSVYSVEEAILTVFLQYLARPPRPVTGLRPLRSYEQIVARARD